MRSLVIVALLSSPALADDLCGTVGASGKLDGLKQCVNGNGERTLTCLAGYSVTGTVKPSITLPGRTPFPGCTLTDPCRAIGYSGKLQNAESCTNGQNGQRTIKCISPFIVAGTTSGTVKLTGSMAFTGCVADDVDYCKRYGYSNRTANVKQCVNGPGGRIVTCIDGFIVSGTALPSIKLLGPAPFEGCVSTRPRS